METFFRNWQVSPELENIHCSCKLLGEVGKVWVKLESNRFNSSYQTSIVLSKLIKNLRTTAVQLSNFNSHVSISTVTCQLQLYFLALFPTVQLISNFLTNHFPTSRSFQDPFPTTCIPFENIHFWQKREFLLTVIRFLDTFLTRLLFGRWCVN